ncbi:MAG: phosphoribosylformylglycinamidine cyclo-ligase, partial [bacterium]|nr:phosphoribosylformylglycinamidine cyclo-ligase [bacterium]
GLYSPGEYDLAGFIVGAVERRRLLTGKGIRAGDILLGLPSTGLHTNGYSLARKLLFEVAGYRVDTYVEELGGTVGDELLKVHRSYSVALGALSEAGLLKGAAHITGGGITDNLPRMLPAGLGARIDTKAWEQPPVFRLLKRLGKIPLSDYRRTFNLGIGMIVVVPANRRAQAEKTLERVREPWRLIGVVAELAPRARKRVVYR